MNFFHKVVLKPCDRLFKFPPLLNVNRIRIYRDRSRRLLGLSQSMYIDIIVKRFGMENSKRGFIPMRHGVQISKEHSPKTPEDKALMEKILYA